MLEYKAYVGSISAVTGVQCPPKVALEQKRVAWRWTFDPMTATCFHPVAVRNPPRLTRAKDAEEKCSCWALSMHQSEAESIATFRAIEESFSRARKTLGTHVATCTIDALHGLSTPADEFGHFDLHPYKSAPFLKTFAMQKAIP